MSADPLNTEDTSRPATEADMKIYRGIADTYLEKLEKLGARKADSKTPYLDALIKFTQQNLCKTGIEALQCKRVFVNESQLAALVEEVQLKGLTDAARDVLAERVRQVSIEGWTPEHDDQHDACEMAAVAAVYAVCDTPEQMWKVKYDGATLWPVGWVFKPKTYRENLVCSAALLLAEIDRLDRRALPTTKQEG